MKRIPIKDLQSLLNAEYRGTENLEISELLDLLSEVPESPQQLVWCSDKNLDKIAELGVGTVIISKQSAPAVTNSRLNILIVENPRQAFKSVLERFFMKKRRSHHVAGTAVIDPSVRFSPDIYIGENVVIEEGCMIGENVFIGHNTIIHSNTVIEKNVTIGCNNTIGSVGFGYEKNNAGEWEVLPHVGNVIIRQDVEIGNNTCIDRAVLGSTVIGINAKIDNLVHVAHGVKIGDNTLIIAHAMLGGSATIGKNVWFGPNASVINKGVINDGALVGMSAVVIKPVEPNTVVAGNPAKFFRLNEGK